MGRRGGGSVPPARRGRASSASRSSNVGVGVGRAVSGLSGRGGGGGGGGGPSGAADIGSLLRHLGHFTLMPVPAYTSGTRIVARHSGQAKARDMGKSPQGACPDCTARCPRCHQERPAGSFTVTTGG